ncbi:MAG: hypothetical protein KAH95_11225 [Spirochaetales bacterium]|nr:hypothetical protein [Spirochaetales bacterium]
MRNRRVVFLVLIISLIASFSAFAEYDGNNVKNVMRANIQLMGNIGKAIETEDFEAAADSLMELAQGMISIRDYSPNRGTQDSWDDIFDGFINTAFIGIGACGTKDIDLLEEAFGELRKFNSDGHSAHK